MTLRHYRHLGSADQAAALILRGWRLVACYEPVLPCIDGDWWLAIGPCPTPPPLSDARAGVVER